MTQDEKEKLKIKLRAELKEIEDSTKQREDVFDFIEKQMSDIKKNVHTMIEGFRKSHFFLSVASNQQYDEDTQFNESNVTMYLSELEEYISLFITYLAYKQDHPDAAIASLSLNELKQKDWENEGKHADVGAKASQDVQYNEEDLETEDDIVTDPRILY